MRKLDPLEPRSYIGDWVSQLDKWSPTLINSLRNQYYEGFVHNVLSIPDCKHTARIIKYKDINILNLFEGSVFIRIRISCHAEVSVGPLRHFSHRHEYPQIIISHFPSHYLSPDWYKHPSSLFPLNNRNDGILVEVHLIWNVKQKYATNGKPTKHPYTICT